MINGRLQQTLPLPFRRQRSSHRSKRTGKNWTGLNRVTDMWPGYPIFADFRAILTERLSFDEAAYSLSFQVIRCERTKRAPYERQQTEHRQTIKLQHGVRGVWNHRFGWTVHGRNRRWRYCSNALSTAVRLECAGIYFTYQSGWTLFIVCTSSVEWGEELAPGVCFVSSFMKATVKSCVIDLFHNGGLLIYFFLSRLKV